MLCHQQKYYKKKLQNTGRLLMYNKNSTGPRVEPCGTPQVIASYQTEHHSQKQTAVYSLNMM